MCPKDRLRICKRTGQSAALCVGPSHCDGGLETSLIAAQNMKWHCSLFGGGEPWVSGSWLESWDALPIQTRRTLQRVCMRTVPEKQGHRRHCRIDTDPKRGWAVVTPRTVECQEILGSHQRAEDTTMTARICSFSNFCSSNFKEPHPKRECRPVFGEPDGSVRRRSSDTI